MKKISIFILLLILLAGCQAPGFLNTPTPKAPPMDDLIEGGEWTLTAINGNPPLKDSLITLSFQDGELGGSAGCNHYGGKYVIQDGRLKTEMISSTVMACMDPEGVMEQEQAYLNALNDAVLLSAGSLRVTENTLEILDSQDQPVLTFNRGQASP